MKKLFYVLFFGLIACGGDDEPIGPLTGIIEGENFEFGEARYEEGTDSRLSIDIFSQNNASGDACTNVPLDVYIFFRADNVLDQQELFLDLSSFEGFTVTLFNPKTSNNIIATSGYFQIINKNEDQITAILDVNFDSETMVSGEFVAELCN